MGNTSSSRSSRASKTSKASKRNLDPFITEEQDTFEDEAPISVTTQRVVEGEPTLTPSPELLERPKSSAEFTPPVSGYHTPTSSSNSSTPRLLGRNDIGEVDKRHSMALIPAPLMEAYTNTLASNTMHSKIDREAPKKVKHWFDDVYKIVNVKGGTSVDLSGGDFKSIIGYPAHDGYNQLWRFEPCGGGFMIRSLFQDGANARKALYLTVEESLCEGTPLIVSEFPTTWKVEWIQGPENGGIVRIFWPSGNYVFDLAGWGSSEPGTKVQLMKLKDNEDCQSWNLIPAQISCVEETGISERTEESTTTPVSETVVRDAHCGGETVTVTKTITSITTVTTTLKSPCRN
ncbi:hypothetical protein C8Q75DRAFT_744126 [Abortiporus biennis]|nr:hypothetical protein C8Q75DRAFT_744126 [Abortiporus biennis]